MITIPMAKTIKIYCRHDDTPKMLKQMKLNFDARSYEDLIRKLFKIHGEKVGFV